MAQAVTQNKEYKRRWTYDDCARLLFLRPQKERERKSNRREWWPLPGGTTEQTHRQMGRLTGRLTSCEQPGLLE